MTGRQWQTEPDLQSPQAEKALMGALGYYPDAIAATLAALDPADFYRPARGAIWAAARHLASERQPVEQIRLMRELTRRGEWNNTVEMVLKTEMTSVAPADHAAQHAATVADLANRRRLLQVIHRAHILLEDHPGDASEVAVAIREAVAAGTHPGQDERSTGPMSWRALTAEFEHEHDQAHERGIPTPWLDYDDLVGGLRGGRMYIYGGRPGQGKSALAITIAHHAAVLGHPALIVSKEMPTVDVTGRVLASAAQVDLQAVNARRLDRYDRERIRDHVKRMGDLPLFADASARRLSAMRSMIRAHHQRHGLDVLVVDYLQLVRTDAASRSRQEEVAEVSRAMKEIALELDCAVVLPAQLNRESTKRTDGRPTMADLRDSGQIEQDADVVTLIHRPDKTSDGEVHPRTGEMDLIVDKNRHGPTATITVGWRGQYGQAFDFRAAS